MNSFTPETLLLHLYKEFSPEQTALLEQQLNENWTLREKLSVFTEPIEKLSRIKMLSPRQKTVESLISYAAATTEVISE